MPTIFEHFDDPYIYGPLTDDQVSTLRVNHRVILLEAGYFVGITQEQPAWADKLIIRLVADGTPI